MRGTQFECRGQDTQRARHRSSEKTPPRDSGERRACVDLVQDRASVPEFQYPGSAIDEIVRARKQCLSIMDAVLKDLRDGIFRGVFEVNEPWSEPN